MATEVGDANRGRDARKVALAMEFEDFLAERHTTSDAPPRPSIEAHHSECGKSGRQARKSAPIQR
jgi:hypothetical protein